MSVDTAPEPPFGNLARQMGKMMEQLQKGYYNFCPTDTWTPSVNLYETESAYVVCVDLAGVDKDKIDIELLGQKLTLRGNRAVPMPDSIDENSGKVRVHLMEIDNGSFCREVELPVDVSTEEINATYQNGLLWIELPKAKEG
jgi:HSP20 family protein